LGLVLSDFCSTAAHEHVHWTGHGSRLDRDLSGRFCDRAYGAEELIAELGAAFWCAQFQLEQATRPTMLRTSATG
jgi:antirestriction protein ArdC